MYNISNPTNDEERPWNVVEHIFLSNLEDEAVSFEETNPIDSGEEEMEMNENEEREYPPWFFLLVPKEYHCEYIVTQVVLN